MRQLFINALNNSSFIGTLRCIHKLDYHNLPKLIRYSYKESRIRIKGFLLELCPCPHVRRRSLGDFTLTISSVFPLSTRQRTQQTYAHTLSAWRRRLWAQGNCSLALSTLLKPSLPQSMVQRYVYSSRSQRLSTPCAAVDQTRKSFPQISTSLCFILSSMYARESLQDNTKEHVTTLEFRNLNHNET